MWIKFKFYLENEKKINGSFETSWFATRLSSLILNRMYIQYTTLSGPYVNLRESWSLKNLFNKKFM